MAKYVSLCLSAALLGACTTEYDGFSIQSTLDVWYQEPTDRVDILWVIDNSNSMGAEQDTLAAGFQSFAMELENTGTDFHLGVITTTFLYGDTNRGKLIGEPAYITPDDDYLRLFPERVKVGVDGDGKEKGLEAAAWALSSVMTEGVGPNAGFLRPDAHLLVVFVSDEDDCSDEGALDGLVNPSCYNRADELVAVDEYVASIETSKDWDETGKVQLAGIVGPNSSSACDYAVPGSRYMEAARLTGGLVGDICQPDWSDMLYDLGLNAVGVHRTFELSHGAIEETFEVTIDDAVILPSEIDGWTYDDEMFAITFHGDAVPSRGSVIRADYDIQPGT
jgi:hypothetical protein